MTKGVFLHRHDSIYNDEPERQYQFPKQYFSRAAQCVGDWIIYYEPRRGGGSGYYAIAKVERIVPDPSASGMYLALIEPGSYLPFEKPVAFSDHDGVIERGLLNDAGKISGRAQSAMRPISLEDFERILIAGIPDETDLLPRSGGSTSAEISAHLSEEQAPFTFEVQRDRVDYLTSRLVRDRVFRTLVVEAYDCRCAITGHRFINGGGRAEVEAAHIRPVEFGGPDLVNNGLALSGTAHWMFDRGLISLAEDLSVMVSRQANDAEGIWKVVNDTRRAIVPAKSALRPHPRFLSWHREHCFKH